MARFAEFPGLVIYAEFVFNLNYHYYYLFIFLHITYVIKKMGILCSST